LKKFFPPTVKELFRSYLIALWDGASGDGAGGTKDMIERVENRGDKAVVLDAARLKQHV
jgi:hypothetical protein